MIPSRNDDVTMACPVCAAPFTPTGRRRFCSDGCPGQGASTPPPTRRRCAARAEERQRRARTVYQCPSCDARAVGTQRCEDCATFMTRAGIGGLCSCCEEAVTIDELMNN